VAELVDATDLKSVILKDVRVRSPPVVLKKTKKLLTFLW